MFNNLCSPLHSAEPVQLSPLIESRTSGLGEKTPTYPDSSAAGLEYTECWEGKHYTAYEHTHPRMCTIRPDRHLGILSHTKHADSKDRLLDMCLLLDMVSECCGFD